MRPASNATIAMGSNAGATIGLSEGKAAGEWSTREIYQPAPGAQ
jgi:hypothetical protein